MSSIFSIKSKKRTNEDRMVGTYVNYKVSSYLNLYTLAKGINKSSLLKSLITSWYDKRVKEDTVDNLIRELIGKAQREWERIKLAGDFSWIESAKQSRFEAFKQEITNELKGRGVDNEHIDRIIENLEE